MVSRTQQVENPTKNIKSPTNVESIPIQDIKSLPAIIPISIIINLVKKFIIVCVLSDVLSFLCSV